MPLFNNNKPNRSLLAARVLLGNPEVTEAELVAQATGQLTSQVEKLDVTIKSEKAIIASAAKTRDQAMSQIEASYDAATAEPKTKIANAEAKSAQLVNLYTQLTK